MIGFDYTERIAPAALKAAGCQVVCRYLSNPGWPKNLAAAEARELLAAGIPILLNYETSADFMLGGYSAGVTCARSARQQAAALGAPGNARIYYSADFDASVPQTQVVVAFLNGAASVDGASNVGVYGGLRVVQAAAAVGYATWQTIAWSNGQWDPRALLRQTGTEQNIGGVQADVNQVMNLGALGAWGATTSTPSTGGPVPNIPPSIAQDIPDVAKDFPPNGPYNDDTAIIWADARAAAAMLYAKQARDEVVAVKAELDGVNNKLDQVLSKLGSLSTGGVDSAVLATDVVHGIGQKLAGA